MGVNDKQLISAGCCNIFLPHLFATSFAVAMMSPKRLNSSHLRRKLKPTWQIYNSGSQSACLPVCVCISVYLCICVCVYRVYLIMLGCANVPEHFDDSLCAAYCQLLSINCAFMSASVESGCWGELRLQPALLGCRVYLFCPHTHKMFSYFVPNVVH